MILSVFNKEGVKKKVQIVAIRSLQKKCSEPNTPHVSAVVLENICELYITLVNLYTVFEWLAEVLHNSGNKI